MPTTVKTTLVIYQPIARSLLATAEALRFMESIAEQGAQGARDINPERSGRSSSQIRMMGSTVEDGVATATFGSDSPIWHILEFGSVKNPPFRALTQAAQRLAGVRYEPK